ncbi:peptidylprolyl isomerase [Prochlorococcus sp. MIT 1307]|uniref:peptidylprolyl isomerase n=1 Tax=Prochlorococcus sp. MIT 1307 TaxID=3096219 RepID=UPI002A751947|nr:peptidylprolyl isomerase [Prochlorococcus sp. MIT 1307]
MTTNRGIILLELYGNTAPITAGNFLDLINKGVYNRTVFHRVIKLPSPFVLQGGDPFSKYPTTPEIDYGKGNFIDPKNGLARFIPLEIKLIKEEAPRYNELVTNPRELSQLELIHERGSIAMARSQSLNSGSAQFYIALKTLPELNGRYSVFGKVVDGIDILDKIKEGDFIIQTKILNNN